MLLQKSKKERTTLAKEGEENILMKDRSRARKRLSQGKSKSEENALAKKKMRARKPFLQRREKCSCEG